jgi:hypothetical protein
VVIPEKKDLPTLEWLTPRTESVVALEQQLLASSKNHLKLFGEGGGKVSGKAGVYTSGHWVCAADWERYKVHAQEKKLATSGRAGMVDFYNFVTAPGSSCCGFTVVGQLMDEMQLDRLSWRLHTLATILDELNIADRYAGSKETREAAVNKLPKQQSMPLTKQKVCCPTIFRGHSPSCVLCTIKPAAEHSVTSEGASSVVGDDESTTSITSASALNNDIALNKQYKHGPSARCVARS